MLRKTAGHTAGRSQFYDADSKVGKQKRQARQRTRSTVLFLAFFCAIALGAMVTFRDSTDFHPLAFRGSKLRVLKKSQPFRHTILPPDSVYHESVEDCNGDLVDLEDYAGSVALIVNVASHWGKTEVSYEGLAELQTKYKDRGFTVLAFPTDDFHQEPGTNEEIQSFVKDKFPQVNFPVFGKSSLASNPVYIKLERHLPNDFVKHNFFKYLVNRKGIAVKLFSKKQEPRSFQDAIEELLEEEMPKQMTTE